MKLKKVVPKKPKLKKVNKPVVTSPYELFEANYTGEYKGNFPYKPERKNAQVIDTVEKLKVLCNKMKYIPAFAFDTEANSLRVLGPNKDFRIADISISWGENNNYDIILGHIRDEDIDRNIDLDIAVKLLKPIFEREDVLIVGHNLKFDMHVMKRIGIIIRTKYLFDTMLASWLCNENTPNGLKENSLEKMGLNQTHFKEVTDNIPNEVKKKFGYKANAKVKDFGLVLVDEGSDYALDDAFYTWCLFLGFLEELKDEEMDKIYFKKSIPFLRVLFKMEEKGVTVDVERLEQMGIDMQEDLDRLQYEIYELSGVEFNIGSSQQKAEILFGFRKEDIIVTDKNAPDFIKKSIREFKEGKITLDQAQEALNKKGYYADSKGKVFKKANRNENILKHNFGFSVISHTDSGNPSTDSDTIWRLSKQQFKNKRKQQGVEMCKKMLEYSKLAKLKTAFVDGILEQLYDDGKAHPSFNQIGTDSGRLSCSRPNLDLTIVGHYTVMCNSKSRENGEVPQVA